jgi:hypothetical protein
MEFRVSAGSESFLWEEFDINGVKLLDESGFRHFVAFDSDSRLNRYWQSDFGGRVYSGTVEYSGQTQSGRQTEPTDTDYDGVQLEIGFSYFPEPDGMYRTGRSGVRMAVGVDSWRRGIHDSWTVGSPAVLTPGYVENYTTVYGRLGAHYSGEGGWGFNVGAKYPLRTTETIGLEAVGFDSDVTLNPQGRFTLYADVGMRFSRSWGAQLYYDSYHFAESDPEPVQSGGATYLVWQPESRQETLGFKVSFTF